MQDTKCVAIYNEVFARIRQGVYAERLPTETELAREFSVNVKTAAKAIRVLAKEGIVERRRNRGTMVLGAGVGRVRPAVNVVAMGDDVFAETNPWRHRVHHFLDLLWTEASRRNMAINLLPRSLPGPSFRCHTGTEGSGRYVIVYGSHSASLLADLLAGGYRPIAIGSDREYFPELRALGYVAIDGQIERGYRDLVSHLRDRGRRRIALVHDRFGKEKARVLADALAHHGLTFDARLAVSVSGGSDTPAAVEALFARGVPFDAMIVPTNESARVVLAALSQRGVRVPADVALACYSGDAAGVSYNNHRFTHLELDVKGYVRKAMDLVVSDEFTPGTHYLPSTLVPGETT